MLLAFNEVEVNFSEVKWQGICFPCRLMSDLMNSIKILPKPLAYLSAVVC